MPRINPLPPEEVEHLSAQFEQTKMALGFVPNGLPTMARVPGLVEAYANLGASIYLNSGVPPTLLQMVAQIASSASGCHYCQAHTATSAHLFGISEEKLADLWLWETSEHFDEAERAALTLAFNAASVPNTATDEHFTELRKHFDDNQIAGIVAAISMFGFLNRWHDTVATELEDEPLEFASRVLSPAGWEVGKHTNG